jgi:hypothetical protein
MATIADSQSARGRHVFLSYASQPENAKEWDLMQACGWLTGNRRDQER